MYSDTETRIFMDDFQHDMESISALYPNTSRRVWKTDIMLSALDSLNKTITEIERAKSKK